MTNNKNNIPIYEEQQFIQEEQQIEQTAEETITELKEKIKILQEELAEEEEENEELNKLVWEGIEKLEKERKEKKDLKTKLNDFKSKLLGSLFKNSKKSKEITELKVQRVRLRAELVNRDQQITTTNNIITTLQEDLQKWRDQFPNQTPEWVQNKITTLTRERDDRPNINFAQWNNDYSKRPTQQQLNNIQRQKNNLQNELCNIRTELNNTKNERYNCQRRWNNHICSCSRNHCDGDYWYPGHRGCPPESRS